MKTLLLLLLAFTITLPSDASVAVYKQSITVTVTGGGTKIKNKFSGFMVVDVDTLQVLFVNVDKKRGVFRFTYPNGINFQQISSGLGKDSTVLTIAGSSSGSLALKGPNTSLDLFANDVHRIPKIMTASGSILKTDGTNFFLEETQGTFAYSASDTTAANVFSDSLPEVESSLRSDYTGKGYAEQP